MFAKHKVECDSFNKYDNMVAKHAMGEALSCVIQHEKVAERVLEPLSILCIDCKKTLKHDIGNWISGDLVGSPCKRRRSFQNITFIPLQTGESRSWKSSFINWHDASKMNFLLRRLSGSPKWSTKSEVKRNACYMCKSYQHVIGVS